MNKRTTRLIELVMGTNRLVHEGSKTRISPLSVLQLRTVLFVKQQGRVTIKDLAEYFCITAPTASVMANHLEKAKLIKRIPDKTDHRITLIHITAKGERCAAAAMKQIQNKMEAMMARLTKKEEATFVKLIEKFFNLK